MKRKSTDKDREYSREYMRRLRAEQPDKVKAAKRAYYARNADNVKAKVKSWYAENATRARATSRRRALAKLGATPEQYAACLVTQKNKCAICRDEFRSKRGTHTDHDHRTGVFRALLCAGCNTHLGAVEKQDGQWLWAALRYLVKHGNSDFAWAYEPEGAE